MATVRMLVMNLGQSFVFRKSFVNVQSFLAIAAISFLMGCNQSADDSKISQADVPAASREQENDYPAAGNQPVLDVLSASHRSGNLTEIKTASINKYRQGTEDYSLPISGTPEWDIRKIALLLAEESHQASGGNAQQSKTSLSNVSNEIALKIIALASHAISETHQRPEKELIFNAAVQSLMDARLSLALSGEKDAIDKIYEDAVAISKDRPGSAASTIAAGAVVRLTQEMARVAEADSPWISEYVRQVKLFATNYPKEEARGIMQLVTAGEFCEQRQLILPAIECYTIIQQQFPKSPFQRKVNASLLRLGLIGKMITLDGPTIDGGTFRLSEKLGRPVVIAFWSSRSAAFEQDVELLNQLVTSSKLHLVGINMDTDASTVKGFIESKQLAGEHVFYTDFSLQGASQPLARQFGINILPTYWFIDEQGRVLATNVSREQLQSLLSK